MMRGVFHRDTTQWQVARLVFQWICNPHAVLLWRGAGADPLVRQTIEGLAQRHPQLIFRIREDQLLGPATLAIAETFGTRLHLVNQIDVPLAPEHAAPLDASPDTLCRFRSQCPSSEYCPQRGVVGKLELLPQRPSFEKAA